MDKQVSKSKLLCAYIAQFIESLRRNRLGPGSNPAQPRNFFSKGYSANLLLHVRNLKNDNFVSNFSYFCAFLSMSMEVWNSMSVKVFSLETGNSLRHGLHSSAGIQGRIDIQRGEKFTFELVPQKEEIEILQAKY